LYIRRKNFIRILFSSNKYLDLPNNLFFFSGWSWVGSGGTNNDQYPSEMQFSGPNKNKNIFYNKLNKYFKAKKNVTRFMILNKYPKGF
jgi:hypothetical protein